MFKSQFFHAGSWPIGSKRMRILYAFHLEDLLELVERDDPVMHQIVLGDDHFDVGFGHFHAQFLHGVVNVVFSDFAGAICVKLVENGQKFLLIQETMQINSSGQELTIIDLAIPLVIHFSDQILNLIITHIQLLLPNNIV